MADEIIEAEEIQEEVEEEVNTSDTKEEVNTEEVPDEEEEKKSFIQKTLTKLGIGGGTNVDDKHEEEEAEGEAISEKFIAAASQLGWSDDEIERFAADYTDEDLEEMIPFLAGEELEQEKEAPAEEEEKPSPEKKLEDNAIVQELRKEIADLKKEVGADKQFRQELDIITSVNTAFDKAAEEFEVFGKTEELPKFPAGPRKGQIIPTSPAVKARNQVWDIANTLMAGGMSVGDAMDEAMHGYKGRNLEKDVQRKMIKGLKRKETKLSAKRMGKETVKTYTDEDEEKADVVRKAARKRGIEL